MNERSKSKFSIMKLGCLVCSWMDEYMGEWIGSGWIFIYQI